MGRRVFDEDSGVEGSGKHIPPSRPGILLHNATTIAPHHQIQGASFRALRFVKQLVYTVQSRNGVVCAFGLEHSLSSPRIMQKSSSTSSLIVEDGESGQEGNEMLLLPESAPPAHMDSNKAAVDADPNRHREPWQDVAR